jgi:hypothetical protein
MGLTELYAKTNKHETTSLLQGLAPTAERDT